MKIYQLVFFSLVYSVAKPLSAQPLLTDNKLRSHLDSVVHRSTTAYGQHPDAVGLSIGVYRNGQMHTYNYGEVKKGRRQLPTSNTFYNLGSLAKTFAGVMLAQAVVDKKVRLDDDIRMYLPGKYPNLAYQGQPIRLVHLANHTSGLPRSARQFPKAITDSLSKLELTGQVAFYDQYRQDSLLRDMHQFKMDTLPGTRYRYNNNAMMVLTLILERIYKQPYEQLVTNYLRVSLGMSQTTPNLSAAQMKQAAQGYEGTKPQTFVNLRSFYLGPNMNSTVSDLLQYMKANLDERDPALKLSHQITWGKPDPFAVGLNWMMKTDPQLGQSIYHDGHTRLGFNTRFVLYPAQKTGIVILVNDTISQDRVFELEQAIMSGL